ncbi:hypothetical protein B0H13DRAFT_1904917 [Mycena leptocephala]|nr:hypothetical protein B0H13DRAFT_1904917 [Mycena leptocephala]
MPAKTESEFSFNTGLLDRCLTRTSRIQYAKGLPEDINRPTECRTAAVTIDGTIKGKLKGFNDAMREKDRGCHWPGRLESNKSTLHSPPPPDLRHFKREEMDWERSFKAAPTSQRPCPLSPSTIDAETSQYTSTIWCIFGYARLQGNHAAIVTSPRSDLHRIAPRDPHPNLRLASPPPYAAPPRKPAIEPRHRIAPKDIHAHAQLPLAESPCTPPIAHDLVSFAQPMATMHTAPSLSMFSPERTNPPPSRTRGRTPTPALANGCLASSAPGDPGRTQAVAPAPRTGTCPCCPAHRKSGQGAAPARTFAAAAPAPDGAEVVQPIPGKDEDSKGARAYSALNRFLIRDAWGRGRRK